MPAVYFSTDAATVAAEADAKANRFGWSSAHLRPQTRIALQVTLQAVLDLTNPVNRKLLNLQLIDLTGCDWGAEQLAGQEALTQAMARAAFESEAEGLLVPSARQAGGVNLVFFSCHRRPGSSITAHDEASIPFVHGL